MWYALAAIVLLWAASALAAGRGDAVRAVFRINENCSAVAIEHADKGVHLITAKHCVKGGAGSHGFVDHEVRDKATLMQYVRYVYTVKQKHYASDLALLALADTKVSLPKVRVAEVLKVDEGDTIWAIGYPLGFTRTVTSGIFNGYQSLDEWGDDEAFYRASAAVTFGNSGGGLFQETGTGFELIGITSRKYRNSEFMNLFVPLEDIRKFLRLEEKPEIKIVPPALDYSFGALP